jgi:hypothetical protein
MSSRDWDGEWPGIRETFSFEKCVDSSKPSSRKGTFRSRHPSFLQEKEWMKPTGEGMDEMKQQCILQSILILTIISLFSISLFFSSSLLYRRCRTQTEKRVLVRKILDQMNARGTRFLQLANGGHTPKPDSLYKLLNNTEILSKIRGTIKYTTTNAKMEKNSCTSATATETSEDDDDIGDTATKEEDMDCSEFDNSSDDESSTEKDTKSNDDAATKEVEDSDFEISSDDESRTEKDTQSNDDTATKEEEVEDSEFENSSDDESSEDHIRDESTTDKDTKSIQPRDTDVIIGLGYTNHPGNVQLRHVCWGLRKAYKNAYVIVVL